MVGVRRDDLAHADFAERSEVRVEQGQRRFGFAALAQGFHVGAVAFIGERFGTLGRVHRAQVREFIGNHKVSGLCEEGCCRRGEAPVA